MFSLTDICPPAQLYVVLTAFTLIVMIIGKQYSSALVKFVFAIIYAFLLNMLCANGLSGVSWFLVLLPFILIGVALLFFIIAASAKMAKDSGEHTERVNEGFGKMAAPPAFKKGGAVYYKR